MTDEIEGPKPPLLGQPAPGLVWRPRKDGWVATWQARTDLTKRGFRPKYVALWGGGTPNEVEGAEIATRCQHLQYDMLAWNRGVEEPPEILPDHFTGNLKSLAHCYQTDPDSAFKKNRFHVRKNRASMLRRIVAKHGETPLSDIKARVLIAWHKEWSQDGKRLASGSAFIGQLRALFSFGATLLEDPNCERLCGVMHKMRFPGTKHRAVSVTADQADLVRAAAHVHFGWHSIALGQAIQFEGTMRQKDVIGEFVPLSEPGLSTVIIGDKKWLRGIVWQEIDENLILRHITSKKQKPIEIDFKIAPMAMEELQFLAGPEPLVVVNDITKKATVNRHLLPASGPVVICDTSGLPWSDNEYRRKWRLIARHCGIPDNVWNMDSRSGAISEAIQAGASMEMVRHTATHSDVSQTSDYDRGQAEATAKVMRMRAEARNRPKTKDD
jgi:hypothetical protein